MYKGSDFIKLLMLSMFGFLFLIVGGLAVRMFCLQSWVITCLYKIYTLMFSLGLLFIGVLLSLCVVWVSSEGKMSFENMEGYWIPWDIFIDPTIPFLASHIIQA